ncbi:MAG: hypothetical protein QOI68_5036, partial [Pseudonocardiales bacterium]|nr:hypothetical protein [Pseudonocardiales bacterium]
MTNMNGQVALVTGGIRGIGAAICARLATRGVTIAAGYSRDKEAADRFGEQYPGASTHQGNIGCSEDCERVVREVLDQHGRLDILVNNAGITLDKTVRKMATDDWDRVIQVNLSGAFYLIRASLQHMLDRGSGRIINISSIIGESGNIGSAQDCERVIQEVLEAHGKLDILVNNAGITADKTMRKMSPEEWDRVIRVNLSGAF